MPGQEKVDPCAIEDGGVEDGAETDRKNLAFRGAILRAGSGRGRHAAE
jgi:hypothetical protein